MKTLPALHTRTSLALGGVHQLVYGLILCGDKGTRDRVLTDALVLRRERRAADTTCRQADPCGICVHQRSRREPLRLVRLRVQGEGYLPKEQCFSPPAVGSAVRRCGQSEAQCVTLCALGRSIIQWQKSTLSDLDGSAT